MNAKELRKLYIDYFVMKGHSEIKTSSLFPNNDPSVLFTTAGMHPLVPYLLGERHPAGNRLVNFQKCVRTGDIDEVGDASHLTFFEMLGNWSLGDYFKEESVRMSYEFLTSVLGIPKEKIAVTCFKGDEISEKDDVTPAIWREIGLPEDQIYSYGKKENWWGPAGETGPCGPDTEIFFDTGKEKCSNDCGPACNCGKFVEIWNNVFMEYNKNIDGSFERLQHKNVDTGLGLERVLAIINGKNSVYDTELFINIIKKIEEISDKKYVDNVRDFRIISDHLRAATFILGDDKAVSPSNVDQGYVLRRLIRRASRELRKIGIEGKAMGDISEIIIEQYGDVYPELKRNKGFILEQINKEEVLFNKTLDNGLKVAEKIFEAIKNEPVLSGGLAFKLFDTFGFPIELTKELAEEKGKTVDMDGFYKKYKEHQEQSRIGAAKKFKGGLVDNSEETTKLHTATHLLNAALRKVLGDSIFQKGSNINSDRLRFDFSYDKKLSIEEIEEVMRLVNGAIDADLPVICEKMTLEEAKAKKAIGVFDERYDKRVKVYSIGDFSKEICGGPHAGSTGELAGFKILKEQSSSAGVRRIKAIIGNKDELKKREEMEV
jgi:alanyl-tRNA synthetase